MPAEIEFRGGPAFVRFQLGAPYEGIPGYLPTTVMVDTGTFRGGCATHTGTENWRTLRSVLVELAATLGDAETSYDCGDEVGVKMTFHQTKLGHLAVLVQLDLHETDAALRFWIDADQTYLPVWIAAIDQALAQLPAS